MDISAFGSEFLALRNGKFALDLSILKRNLKDTIIVDVSKESVHGAKDHIIVMDKFLMDPADNELNKLAPLLLRTSWVTVDLANPKVKDVGAELSKFGDDPIKSYYEKLKTLKEQQTRTTKKVFYGLPRKAFSCKPYFDSLINSNINWPFVSSFKEDF